MTKTFCDGCGKEIEGPFDAESLAIGRSTIFIRVEASAAMINNPETYCRSCVVSTIMASETNPQPLGRDAIDAAADSPPIRIDPTVPTQPPITTSPLMGGAAKEA